ncbi:DUF2510 domain-containing protein [Streptomyces atratus]|uniref:DUF2510 domain-containing protein n=1 Tax=Streptomyces atratus TaxID=1893 RepID=UPI0037B7AB21
MSTATPPGWHPDAASPGTERWWDGTAWTAHTRPIASVPQQSGPPEPVANAYGNGSGSAATGGGARVVALAVEVARPSVDGRQRITDRRALRFDAGPDGPPLSLMDTITEEIRPIDDSGTSGGVGSSVAP